MTSASRGGAARRSANALRSVFAEPDLARVEIAWAVSIAALWAWLATVSAVSFEHRGVLAAGTMLAIRQVVGGVAAPFATVLARRWGQLDALIGVALLRAAAIGAGAVLLASGSPFPLLYLAVAVEGLGSGSLQALQAAVLPWLARSPAQLAAANGVTEMLRSAGFLLGPGLSAVLLLFCSPAAALTLWSAGLLVSAALLVPFRRGGAPAGHRAGSVLKKVIAGIRNAFVEEDVRTILGVLAVAGVTTGAMQVYATALAIEVLGLGTSGPPAMYAIVGLGGIAGGMASLSLSGRRDLASPLTLGLASVGLGALLMGAFPSRAMVIAGLCSGGLALSLNRVAATTLLQRAVPVSSHGAVLGVNQLLQLLSIGAGGLIGSLLAEGLGIRGALIATAVLLPSFAVLRASRLQRITAASAVPQRELAALQRSDLFSLLPVGPQEQLAARLRPLQVAAGTEIVRENESGDTCFLIERGRVGVSAAGRLLPELGSGEMFGEISILHSVPRTATVVALEPSELWCIEASDFLEAMSGGGEIFSRAKALASRRREGLA